MKDFSLKIFFNKKVDNPWKRFQSLLGYVYEFSKNVVLALTHVFKRGNENIKQLLSKPFQRFSIILRQTSNGSNDTNTSVSTVSKFLLLFFLLTLINLPAQNLFIEMNKNSIGPNEVIAQIGDNTITAEEFFYSYEFGPAFIKRENNSKQNHLKYMINEKLIALAGYDENVLSDDKVNSLYSDFKADLATEEMFKDEILGKIEIDPAVVDTIINSKLIELELEWLFAPTKEGIQNYYFSLHNGASFDSLFTAQINDSIFLDMRSMKTTAYSLRKNNHLLSQIIDTLEIGNYSAPIHVNNEWYIMKLANMTKSMITNKTEFDKLSYEAEQAVIKFNMDRESDKYIDSLMRSENPVIKKDGFEILRTYLGKYVLDDTKYDDWNLDFRLDRALSNLGLSREDEYDGIDLVYSVESNYTIDEFIIWYRNRSLNIKFDKTNLNTYSKSLENLIWRMVRDKLLTKTADEKGYFNRDWVKTQSDWWRDKIAYSAMRNKLVNSIKIENSEVNISNDSKSDNEKLSLELIKKMFRVIEETKKKTKVAVNQEVLDRIAVTSSNDANEIELYTAKTGGLMPRPPYPTIDNEWVYWE